MSGYTQREQRSCSHRIEFLSIAMLRSEQVMPRQRDNHDTIAYQSTSSMSCSSGSHRRQFSNHAFCDGDNADNCALTCGPWTSSWELSPAKQRRQYTKTRDSPTAVHIKQDAIRHSIQQQDWQDVAAGSEPSTRSARKS